MDAESVAPDLRSMFALSLIVWAFLFGYNLIMGSQWLIDALLTGALVIAIFALNKWLRISKPDFLLINLAALLHNLGTFGAYELNHGVLGWDLLVHFASSAVAAWVLYDFIVRKTRIRRDKRMKHVNEHTIIMLFLVIASTAALGVIIELAEFGAYMTKGTGDGLLGAGAGDYDSVRGNDGNYGDTMFDILANTAGSVVGALAFHNAVLRKKRWLTY